MLVWYMLSLFVRPPAEAGTRFSDQWGM